ncbi:DUF389 domain-containing protein [Demequina zhanjiangensis]|uniref:DUF389 domain-containing protein n=1 Tax=Demequina zhanjiangensis TaxID=3051659 RepID=A0ABT8FZ69_9MICO|nr:DUF389 domain-containing protein [Demequina sp. SYSU T00b26]MDN4472057.1 DUF389 domain-containing protein [Demequina sp. SYSU T00b26]
MAGSRNSDDEARGDVDATPREDAAPGAGAQPPISPGNRKDDSLPKADDPVNGAEPAPETGAIPALRSGAPGVGSTVKETLIAITNPVALRGVGSALGGGLVLLLPGLAFNTLQLVFAVALFGSAALDVIYVFSGRRRWGRQRHRAYVMLRALLTLGFLALVGLLAFYGDAGDGIGLELAVVLAGFYVLVRALLVIGSSIRGKNVAGHRVIRIASGVAAAAMAVLAIAWPDAVVQGALVILAVGALILGALLVAWGLRYAEHPERTQIDPYSTTIGEVLWDWIRQSDIGKRSRAEVSQTLYFEGRDRLSKLGAWWVMLVLSVAIASYAVMADSTAVVIGAMLVAPLMVPILGLAGALVNGWANRAGQSVLLVGLGTGVAILLSYGLAAWAPVAIAFDTNTQITSRVNPTALDMLIALAAGAAGAFATVNSRVASGIAGVAIAVALVPPLAVTGISLAKGREDDALGSFLLYLTNFVAIVVAAAFVFVLTGFARHKVLQRNPWGIVATVAPYVALAAVVMVPLVFTSQSAFSTSSNSARVQTLVEDWLGDDSDLLVQSISIDGSEITVMLVGPGQSPDPRDLQDAIVDDLNWRVALTVGVTPVEVTVLPTATPSTLLGN